MNKNNGNRFIRIMDLAGSALYSFFVEPAYGIVMGQDGMRALIMLSFLFVGVFSFMNAGRASGFFCSVLGATLICATLSSWFPDPFVFAFGRIIGLGWLLFLVPALSSFLAVNSGVSDPLHLFYGALAVCLVSSSFRTWLNFRKGDRASEKKERRRRGDVPVEAESFSAVFSGLAPKEAKRRYAALMKRFHPDNGGDPEKAKEINLAFQAYRRGI